MLKRLYQLIKPSKSPLSGRQTLNGDDHKIDPNDLSSAARKVIEQLTEAGYCAYLVGGSVRDLLLHSDPKDFDIATDATPEQVKAVFKSARLIGKRFRIVHVRYGREIIEVTTFRGRPDTNHNKGDASRSDKGLLLRDNVYGDIESDALRRDFTVNALYYDMNNGAIYDYAGGIEDLSQRQLRLIGDPATRYQEDPVRMLRAVRFAAKLGFVLEENTQAPIATYADHLSDIPPARLFEEVLKLFISGYATPVLASLRDFGLLRYLFPGTDACLQTEDAQGYYSRLVQAAVINTDKRIRHHKRVTPAFIYAAMLWPPLHRQMQTLIDEQNMKPQDAMQLAAQGVIAQQLSFTSIPKRFVTPMRDIWFLQAGLQRRDKRRMTQLLENRRFRAAYDFLLLREEAGEALDGLGVWWTRLQAASEAERQVMIDELSSPGKRRRPRKRRSKAKPPAQDRE